MNLESLNFEEEEEKKSKNMNWRSRGALLLRLFYVLSSMLEQEGR